VASDDPKVSSSTELGAFERTDVISRVRTLSGKYKLGRLLGEGGMGAVYEAEHTGLEAKVAIKVLSEGGSLDHKALTRFRREARAMGAIRHENVVTVLDTGADDEGVPYLVMELLEGESLAGMLRRERVLAPSLAIWIGSQVLSGLSAAHAKGVIHRDLKPGNVFIARQADASHKVKILDFGISKLSESSESMNVTADGALVGTPNFMAPEQITGQGPIDARVDIYAVGVLIYRMVTGRLPFVGKTSDELYRKILAGQPVPPRRRQPDVPAELEAAVLRSMALDREQRFPDAVAFRDALQEIARALPGDLPALPTAMPTTSSSQVQIALEELSQAATMAAAPGAVRRSGRPTGAPSGSGPMSASHSAAHAAPSMTYVPPAPRRPAVWVAGALAVLLVGGGTVAAILATKDQGGGAGAGVPAYDGPALRYGIKRYSSHEEVLAAHQPIVDYLARTMERPVELVLAEDDLELREQLAAGAVDVAALSPYGYVRTRTEHPDLVLLAKPVTSGGSSYQGHILTRADAGIQRLTDLTGKKFCFVEPGSTSGYLYPRALLRQAGIDPDASLIAVYGQDHLATLRLLDRGACDAASVYAKILETGAQYGMPADRFHVLASTDRIPYDAYVMRPAGEGEAIKQALLALEPGSELAAKVFGGDRRGEIIGFARAADADYEGVRRIEHLLDDDTPRR
jgi:eukaryotic-like serine/threonine-protein kinase